MLDISSLHPNAPQTKIPKRPTLEDDLDGGTGPRLLSKLLANANAGEPERPDLGSDLWSERRAFFFFFLGGGL